MRIEEHHMSAAAHNTTFSPIQQQVIAHLSTGLSFTAAAEAAGIHRNTIANWRREIPSFATAFEKAARDQARAFQEEALDAVPQAIQAILSILNDPATPPAFRLRAAGMILKTADIKSAAQERETMIVMQPGVRIIQADPETEGARAQHLAELEKRQPQSSAAPRSPRQSLRSHYFAESPQSSEILHNSAQPHSPGELNVAA
jgi:transposase-like protein